jgi:hypothetical protein
VGAHATPRATGDLDIWVRPTAENAARVWTALVDFGAPLRDLTVDDLAVEGVVFQIGVPPRRIDILTAVTGVTFDEAWPERTQLPFGDVTVPALGLRALIKNKEAVGRPKDIADLHALRELLQE